MVMDVSEHACTIQVSMCCAIFASTKNVYTLYLFFSLPCCCEWLSGTTAVDLTQGMAEYKMFLGVVDIYTYTYMCAQSILMHFILMSLTVSILFCFCLLTGETYRALKRKVVSSVGCL